MATIYTIQEEDTNAHKNKHRAIKTNYMTENSNTVIMKMTQKNGNSKEGLHLMINVMLNVYSIVSVKVTVSESI